MTDVPACKRCDGRGFHWASATPNGPKDIQVTCDQCHGTGMR